MSELALSCSILKSKLNTHHQSLINMPISHIQGLITVLLLACVRGYIDITLPISSSSSDIAFNVPFTIGGTNMPVAISLENKEEFIVVAKKSKGKSGKGELKVSSLEGYTLQGWRRYFIEVFTMAESRYYHKLQLDLTSIPHREKYLPLTSGVMTLGPQLNKNKIYQLIKTQTPDYFQKDIVSFYSAPGGKELHLQLGGYEEQNARGYKNGVRFYQRDIETSADNSKWVLPVTKLVLCRERGAKWDTFNLPGSAIKPTLSLQSQFVVLPQRLREDLQTSLETDTIECSFSSSSGQLQCSSITPVDQALTMLSFYLDDSVSLNISLYDLRDQYNTKSKVTSFFVKLGKEDEVQIGAPLLRGYYLSLDMSKPSVLFSPVNRFTPEITSVSVLRFIIFFVLFMVAACVCVVVWKQFNEQPQRTRRFTRGKDGVKLVAYQRPGEQMEDQF